jgi:putative ABC transport system permease protein
MSGRCWCCAGSSSRGRRASSAGCPSWWARRLQLGVAALVVAALGAIAWALSDSAKVGGWFALLFSIALIVLLIMAAVTLWVLRFLLNRVRLRLPSFLRHGLANLYRPGNQSAAVMAALGTGVMLILAVYLMQASLLRDLRETASPKLPNVFLIDVTTDEVAGVKDFFARQPGVSQASGQSLELMPVVTGRLCHAQRQAAGPTEGAAFSPANAGECAR